MNDLPRTRSDAHVQHNIRAVRKTVPLGWFAEFFDN